MVSCKPVHASVKVKATHVCQLISWWVVWGRGQTMQTSIIAAVLSNVMWSGTYRSFCFVK